MTDTADQDLTQDLNELADQFHAAALTAPTLDMEQENHHRARQTRLVANMVTEYASTTTSMGAAWLQAGQRLLKAEAETMHASLELDRVEAETVAQARMDEIHASRSNRRSA